MHRRQRERLAAQRAQLTLRVARQRQQLARAAAPLAPPWRWVERGWRLWGSMRRRPWLWALPAAALVWWRPRAALGAVASASTLWRASRAVLRLLRGRGH